MDFKRASEADNSAGQFRVMVVDDNVELAAVLGWIAEEAGYDTLVTHDGGSALDLAPQFKPDVIILDLGLPQIDGLQICRALRADPRLADVKIMAHTAKGDAASKEKTAQAGFDLHLVKPVDVSVLLQSLDLFKTSRAISRLT